MSVTYVLTFGAQNEGQAMRRGERMTHAFFAKLFTRAKHVRINALIAEATQLQRTRRT